MKIGYDYGYRLGRGQRGITASHILVTYTKQFAWLGNDLLRWSINIHILLAYVTCCHWCVPTVDWKLSTVT